MAKYETPNLDNATPAFLVDAIKEQREIAAKAKFLEGVYRLALEARIPQDSNRVVGEKYVGEFVRSSQERLNTELIRSEMDSEWIGKYTVSTPTVTLKIEPKPEAIIPIGKDNS